MGDSVATATYFTGSAGALPLHASPPRTASFCCSFSFFGLRQGLQLRGYNCNLFWCEANPDVEQSEATSQLVFVCAFEVRQGKELRFMVSVPVIGRKEVFQPSPMSLDTLHELCCRREAATAGESSVPTLAIRYRPRWSRAQTSCQSQGSPVSTAE